LAERGARGGLRFANPPYGLGLIKSRDHFMSMEIFVLSDLYISSISEWQRAIDVNGFALRLSPDIDLEKLNGLLPVQMESKKTGFEIYHDNAAAVMAADLEFDFGRPWRYALAFRFIGDFTELRAAWMAATAYASSTAGVLYDPQEARLYTAAEAVQAVHKIERDWPSFAAAVDEVTRKILSKRQ
jgi:hypothetical protein